MSTSLPQLPLPKLVNLESTLGCNLACVMCASHLTGITRVHRVVDDQILDQVEDQLLVKAQDLALTVAGEPFMTSHLPKFVDVAERCGVRLQLTSNATLIRDDALLRRVLAHTSVIHFSVDGATAEVFESIRVNASFERVIDNIRLVSRVRQELDPDRRPRLALSVVMMRRNVDQLVALVDLAADLDLDAIGLAHLTVMTPELDAESLRHTPELADHWIEAARKQADRRELIFTGPPRMNGQPAPISLQARFQHFRRELSVWRGAGRSHKIRALGHRLRLAWWSTRVRGRVPCHYLQARAYVSIGGDVTPCCMPGRPVVGNLHEQPFEEIWNGPILTAMRRGFLEGTPFDCCRHCNVNPHGYLPSDEHTIRPPTVQLEPGMDQRQPSH